MLMGTDRAKGENESEKSEKRKTENNKSAKCNAKNQKAWALSYSVPVISESCDPLNLSLIFLICKVKGFSLITLSLRV